MEAAAAAEAPHSGRTVVAVAEAKEAVEIGIAGTVRSAHDATAPSTTRRSSTVAARRSVAELAEKAGFNVARRSLQQDPAHAQVYLGDTMGELMMLYGAGDMAFVGGSLIERGGHNPLEPAAWGIPVLSGPHVFNFETVYERLRAGEGVVMVQSGDELGQAVVRLMATREERQALGERALAVVNKNRGALDRVVEGIVERL